MWVLLVAGVAIAALAAMFVMRKRLDAAERTLRSIALETGSEDVDSSLVRDVRGLKAVAGNATEEAERLRSVLAGAPTGLALVSPDGAIVYRNPAAAAYLDGAGQQAVLRTRVGSLAQRAAAAAAVEQLEVELHDPDRKVLVLTAVPTSHVEAGEPVALYIQDLSTQRRVDLMRTDFVANASHELKTPLGALAILAETLADTRDDEVRARLARRLREEAARMANMIDDVLRLAETESIGIEHSALSVVDLVREVVSSVEGIASDRGVVLTDAGMADAVVAADRDQLASAVRNLLDNAITYTAIKDDSGVVTVRTFVQDETVCIEISDTGIGIPARYADRVFERFFRVDRARSRTSGSTGLGLSIVRNVALAHGGTVAVESRVGVGSTFTIYLPILVEVSE